MTSTASYANLMRINRELKDEITKLKHKLYGDRKLSKCCGAILVPYISLNKKYCPDCMCYTPWEIKPNQKGLFNNSKGK